MKHRKHIRLKGFDYSARRYYFVTVCTKGRQKLFVPFVKTNIAAPSHGAKPNVAAVSRNKHVVAAGPWPAEKKKHTNIIVNKLHLIESKLSAELDHYCIMEDHVHFILAIQARQGRAATSLSWIINAFKGWCTREIGYSIFQPNYYEHIVRNDSSLTAIRQYMANNPRVAYQNIDWESLDNSH